MAIVALQFTEKQPHLDVFIETLLLDGESEPILVKGYSDATVQLTGTYNGATVIVQGSNDGVTWFTMENFEGTTLSFTTGNQLESVRDNVKWLKIVTSGGGGTTDIDASVFASH